jgi:Methyltransferase domain
MKLMDKVLKLLARRAPTFAKRWWKSRRRNLMLNVKSGHPRIDKYLAKSYYRVPGMSSRFAAAICGHLIHQQTALNVTGDVVEIGSLEGRFFIAMALGLADGEKALAVDRFDWPDAQVEGRFLANCRANGVPRELFLHWKIDSRNITEDDFARRLDGRQVRFAHIDGHHTRECLANDLKLVHQIMHNDGIICIDDMLHPGYPLMITAVFDYLSCNPAMQLLCIIDREDIAAATKFLICRKASRALYELQLLRDFSRFHHAINADMGTYSAMVLAPHPRTDDVG